MLICDVKTLFHDSVSTKKRIYKTGEFIFRQGDSAHSIFVVEQGRIKLERHTIEGRTVVMHIAEAGGSFAEAALFSNMYCCNAIAVIPSQIILFPKENILNVLYSNPKKTMKYIALLSSQVRTLRTRLELTNILSARERILQSLLLSTNHDTREFVFYGTLKDFASELGLAHETFYRELSRLEKDGIIERNNNRIKILQIYAI